MKTSTAFPHIFSPFTLKGLTLRNRIAISGHFAGWWVEDDMPGERFARYVEERAKGGVGLFVIGATSPETGSGWMTNVSDAIIPRYRMAVEAGHKHGAAVFAQLCHPGFRPLPGVPIVAPPLTAPGVPSSPPGERPLPTTEKLQELIAAFGAAAGRAAEGGADGLEVHSHESFLHAQMLNPLWNTRTDEYGGSLENRMRFLVETLEAMRKAIGPDLPLGVRLKLDDMAQRGMTLEEYIEVAQRLEAGGWVDYILFTGGDGRFHHGPMPRPDGEWVPLLKQMRAAIKLPMMHAGRITTPEMAEQVLADGDVDVVCMTKTHICDPHFTLKVAENRLEDIRYCTRCLQCCHGAMDRMTCVYNPFTSRERDWAELVPAAKPKRVVIVGGGPAGMECAITASQRGHEVIVLERSGRVGGQVWYGASSPLRQHWGRIADFYERQRQKNAFEVRINMEADAETIVSLQPDTVVIATGSRPKRMEIPGGPPAFNVHEALTGACDDARQVVVYDNEGFNRPGVVADYLSSRGITVHYVSPQTRLMIVGDGMMLEEMTVRLQERGVAFSLAEAIVGWEEPGVLRLSNLLHPNERLLYDVDAVVAAVGSESVSSLAEELKGRVPEIHVIGDAVEPKNVEVATMHGATLARAL